ncbi:hypothetical protein HIM_03818 [Hirsutella minnesotensis 3608]|uniref:Uncharacterized protein n=1 Tax=Hirsutella minnesotensis 3608 TaxID=1043627 RepID=A0A0F7ZM29_9HYPO|nr:hypothetical protein HIM_03818 [Hirsutella minnesotensis 3608]
MPKPHESEYDLASNSYGLLRIVGGWGNVRGPGLVMFQSMVAGTTCAAVFGLTASVASSMLFGTATLPFIIGSSIGFALGSLRWYIASTKEALLQLSRYPSLLRLHIAANFPWIPEYSRRHVSWFTVERFSSDWVHKSILIASWLSAQPALEEIHSQVEASIVQQCTDSGLEEGNVEAVADEKLVRQGTNRSTHGPGKARDS